MVWALKAPFRNRMQAPEAHLLSPREAAQKELPALRITHSHFPILSSAIHVIRHFRREGGLRSGGQGENPGPAEHHAGVDRCAAVLRAFQGR